MVAEKGRALVVLVHGFLGTRIQLIPMASMLARKYDVLNFGYRSRQDTVRGHAQLLHDTVAERLDSETRLRGGVQPTVHFVSHSFGGVVVHRALSEGLCKNIRKDGKAVDVGGQGATRCVMIAPPLRGAAFARAFQRDRLRGPNFLKGALHATAASILGPNSGAELMHRDTGWFSEALGVVPEHIGVLVVAGAWGRPNPLIDDVSDGIVAVRETVMNRRHFRVHVKLTHNFLLYSKEVRECVGTFLEGRNVGELVDGVALRTQIDSGDTVLKSS